MPRTNPGKAIIHVQKCTPAAMNKFRKATTEWRKELEPSTNATNIVSSETVDAHKKRLLIDASVQQMKGMNTHLADKGGEGKMLVAVYSETNSNAAANDPFIPPPEGAKFLCVVDVKATELKILEVISNPTKAGANPGIAGTGPGIGGLFLWAATEGGGRTVSEDAASLGLEVRYQGLGFETSGPVNPSQRHALNSAEATLRKADDATRVDAEKNVLNCKFAAGGAIPMQASPAQIKAKVTDTEFQVVATSDELPSRVLTSSATAATTAAAAAPAPPPPPPRSAAGTSASQNIVIMQRSSLFEQIRNRKKSTESAGAGNSTSSATAIAAAASLPSPPATATAHST